MGGTNTTLAHGATHFRLQIPMSGAKMELTTLSIVRGRDLSNLSMCWVLMRGCVEGELQMSRQVLHNLSTFKLRSSSYLATVMLKSTPLSSSDSLSERHNFAPDDKRSYRCKVQHVVKQSHRPPVCFPLGDNSMTHLVHGIHLSFCGIVRHHNFWFPCLYIKIIVMMRRAQNSNMLFII